MKILYIISSVSMAGATISFINMVKELSVHKSIESVVVIPKGSNNIDISEFNKRISMFGIKIIEMPVPYLEFKKLPRVIQLRLFAHNVKIRVKTKLKEYEAYKKLERLVLQEKPDIIHTNVGTVHVGFKISQKYRIPHVWHLREYQDLDFGWVIQPSKKKFEGMLNKSAVVTITKDIFDHFHLENNSLASVVYNGIFRKNEAVYIDEKDEYFLICSRLSPEKGIKEAIEAFCNFCKVDNKYKLKILGSVDTGNLYYQELVKIVDNYQCRDRVDFLGFKSDVRPYMKKAKALIVASFHEGFGRMTAEACFMGCVVIGRNSSGTKEIIDYTGGLLYDGSQNDLVTKMQLLAKMSQKEYGAIALNAMNRAKEQYSIEANADAIYNIYKTILKK